ncbi:MAG: phosphatidate cytidylyltransferase [Betaproteobacteria bacterium]|nr:phosphatidate cytidylyltransferase [Betaproteobacteria bacterium]
MLKTRVITGVALLAGLLAALFFLPMLGWMIFCALICALAAWEWGGLAGWGGKARVAYGAVLGSLCPVFAFYIFFSHDWAFWLTWFALLALFAGFFWLLIVPFWLWRKWRLHHWSAVLVGILVLVPSSVFFIGLREIVSPLTLLAVCALVWVADIAAYFSGRAFGRKKLAPNISPGKTWAGAIGAVIGVLVYGNVVSRFSLEAINLDGVFVFRNVVSCSLLDFYLDFHFLPKHVLLFQSMLIVLAVWSIIGDLFESLLKRQAGVKDSSNLLPGHGGILDRIDSLFPILTLIGIMVIFVSDYH